MTRRDSPESSPRRALSGSVTRAWSILRCVGNRNGQLTIPELVREVHLPRSSVYELVGTLEQLGCLEQTERGHLRLGLAVLELGSAYMSGTSLIEEARTAAKALATQVSETCHVGILDGHDVVYLVKEDGVQDHVVQMVSAVGKRVPAHGSALGKVLLASLAKEDLESRLDGYQLEQLTPQTLVSTRRLVKELQQVSLQGYAVDDRESSAEVSCVAAPIRDHSGDVIAGISVSVPTQRMSEARQKYLLSMVTSVAEDLSSRLGYRAEEFHKIARQGN